MKTTFLTVIIFTFSIAAFAQKDTSAIKKVINDETASFFKHDFKKSYSYWHVKPQSTYVLAQPDGKAYYLTSKDINEANGEKCCSVMVFPDKIVRSNWKFIVNGTSACVFFEEAGWKNDQITSNVYEVKYLEKYNGEWKIVSASIVTYRK